MSLKFESIYFKGRNHARKGHGIRAAILKAAIKIWYHCEVPYEANISEDVYFYHNAFGVVINARASIGSGTKIQHGVTIGSMLDGKGAPSIGEGCLIGARALILGDVKVGDGARIGAGAVVIKDVPAGCTAVGVPARIITRDD